jgi:hypothetical protein
MTEHLITYTLEAELFGQNNSLDIVDFVIDPPVKNIVLGV